RRTVQLHDGHSLAGTAISGHTHRGRQLLYSFVTGSSLPGTLASPAQTRPSMGTSMPQDGSLEGVITEADHDVRRRRFGGCGSLQLCVPFGGFALRSPRLLEPGPRRRPDARFETNTQEAPNCPPSKSSASASAARL